MNINILHVVSTHGEGIPSSLLQTVCHVPCIDRVADICYIHIGVIEMREVHFEGEKPQPCL